MRIATSILWALSAFGLAAPAAGQASEFTASEARFPAPLAIQQGWFGTSVSVSGDTLAVGMPGANALGSECGVVYIWQRVSGVWQARPALYAVDGGSGAKFSIVSVQGDRMAVGAPGQIVQGVFAGAVYIYYRIAGVWTFQAQLQRPGPQFGGGFGTSVALDGGRVLIGARGNQSPGTAYVFAESGGVWSLEGQLDGPDARLGDNYGIRVCLRGDTAVIGAPDADLATVNEGAAYVFGLSGAQWSFQSKLTASNASESDEFGSALDCDGSTLVVGASSAGDTQRPGAVYLFENQAGVWVETEELKAVGGLSSFAGYGASVKVSGDHLVIGAPRAGNYPASGAAYFYQRLGGVWLLRQRLGPHATDGGPNFGAALAFDGELLAVGAPLDGSNPSQQGALYTFRFTSDFDAFCYGDGSGAACPCSNTSRVSYGMGCSHSGGRGGRLLAEGVASVSADTVRLRGSEMPAGFGLYLQAKAPLNVGTGSPRMDGLMCVGGPLIRLGGETISGLGLSSYPGVVTDPPISVRGGISPGDVRYYQVYFRDNAAFCTSATANYSNAVRIVWQP